MSAHNKIQPFHPKAAAQAEYAALNHHNNRMRLERLPDDHPIPLDESIQALQNIPPFVGYHIWCAWNADQSEIIAQGNLALVQMEENRHLGQLDITVQAEYRRQGIGRQLLTLAAEAARQDHRRLLIAETSDRVPAGEAFMRRLDAQKGLETHVNQLRLVDLDHSLLKVWLARGQASAREFELGFWDGPYPEEQLAAVVDLIDLTNQQPFGELELEDMHMTAEQLRQSEQALFARGSQRWTFYIVDKQTGKFAGYTETVWNPNRPEILRQDMTGVFPEYRRKGLGRWLKAAMLDKVLKERPLVKFVRTGNADSNAAMLKINHELGFKPYMASTIWQVGIEQILKYIGD